MCTSISRRRSSLLGRSPPSLPRPIVVEQAAASSERATTPRHGAIPATLRGRRRFKSTLYFALTLIATSTLLFSPSSSVVVCAFSTATGNRSGMTQRRSEWIERSVQYYSTVLRKDTTAASNNTKKKNQMPKTQMNSTTVSSISEVSSSSSPSSHEKNDSSIIEYHDKDFVRLATNHYYARFLIKEGKWSFAEKIYRRIINELTSEEDNCDHTKLAVSTLLLALHMQRFGDVKATRAVFISFFRRVALVHEHENEDEVVHKCTCSAKVLQAYALFEMKNGHSAKSLEIIQRAVKMDEKLKPVLGWKQFRDAAAGREYEPTVRLWTRRENKFKSILESKYGGIAAP